MPNPEILSALAGGGLIGLSAGLLYLALGRTAGVSGVLAAALSGPRKAGWQLAFLAGLLAGGLVLGATWPTAMPSGIDRAPGLVLLSGLLVGFGAQRATGCTSGHGVCGMSRLSPRSFAATLTFVGVGMATATLAGRVLGATP